MRKIRYFILSTILLTAAACQKVEEVLPEPEPVPQEESFMEFVSERPQIEDPTRTYWNGTTILWKQDDKIRMGYTVNGIWQNASGNASGDAKLYASVQTTLSEGDAVASFKTNTSFNGTTSGYHVFYAVYPDKAVGNTMTTPPMATVTIPSVQTPAADSFDPSADLMLGHSIDSYTERPSVPVRLLWNRVVAHGLITLKALPGTVSGETVTSIILTAQSGADLAGAQDMDITTGACSASSGNATPNVLTIQGDNLSLDVNGNVTFWMSLLPVTLTELTVQVETDKATYTRSITNFTREFLANRRNILSINMAGAKKESTVQPVSEDVYKLVTQSEELGEGHYLIAYTSGTTAKVLSGKGSGDFGAYSQDVPVTDGSISIQDAGEYDIEVKATVNGYSLKQGSQYLGYTSSSLNGNNFLYFSSDFIAQKYEWSLSVASDGAASITNVYNTYRLIQWNKTSPRFACYTGSQQAVQLYKLESAGPMLKTLSATDITVSSAILNARFANLGTTNVQDLHFLFGTSPNALTEVLEVGSGYDLATGEFHFTRSSLTEATTYYYKAVMQYCTDGANYILLEGEVLSFTTKASSTGGNEGLQWLGCFEMPAIALVNSTSYSGIGGEMFGSTSWYNYETMNSKQKVVTHTYKYQNKIYRNYTALIDKDKRCPLWTAYVMHSEAYPNLNVGRGAFNDDTSYDPAIPGDWQSNGSTSDYNGGTGYARGHHCASEDRQTCEEANDQTFYYTNQSPQIQNSFNGGIWMHLESAVQSHAPSGRDTLYVVVGTLFEDGNSGASNDGGIVARPSHFYKLLMKCSFNNAGEMTGASGIAYKYANQAHTGQNAYYYYPGYVTTIRAIEEESGFDFFTNVPAEFQEPAEIVASALWNY